MKSDTRITPGFPKGHKYGTGRQNGSQNEALKTIKSLQEHNAISLYEAHLADAMAGDKDCRAFLLERIMPKLKPGRSIDLTVVDDVKTIDGVVNAQESIYKDIAKGNVTPEEGQIMVNILETSRKAIETKEIIEKMAEMDSRLTEGGL